MMVTARSYKPHAALPKEITVQRWTLTIYEVYDIYATQLVMQHELKPHVSLAH